MFAALLDRAIQWRMAGLGEAGRREGKDPALVQDIYENLMLGVRAGLAGASTERLTALEATVPWNRRLFFWEGLALGVSCGHAFLGRPGNPFAKYRAPGFRFMFWTGLGFWNAAGSPFPRVSLDPARWTDVPDFLEEYPLILGGTSFGTIARTARVDPSELQDIPGIRNAADMDGIYLGVGRALWFLYTRNHARLAEALDAQPDFAEAKARGLGVAITLTQLATPERILPEIAALPSPYWPELLGGSFMAFTCALMDDARVDPRLDGFPAPLDVLIQEARMRVPSFRGPGWTAHFEEAIYAHMARWNGLQPPARPRAARDEPLLASL